ncbi:hypothetical protein M5E06_21125 [Azospirillum sp. A1-3]|uniref:hypothetical protein n=1 Tax=Azospirillum sp. A1-3 TaxID=185874 RepID=UPI0020773A91|nr:hypothetical protein [Azospirillum sp. A1-3]MCM8736633.1 hypothetical protein [Azospirillum sp. A1-3]
MAEECTCHLGAPPCGYCVEGTENYQEASALAEELDDRELARLMDDIDRIREERAKKAGAPSVALPVQPPLPINVAAAPKPDLTPQYRIAQIGLNLKVFGLREKWRKSMVKAMAIPSDPKPWAAFEAADRAYYEPTNLGPKGDGAQWDNRRQRVR